MLPAFKGAIAAAFATGAYVLVITTLWLLADSVGWARLLLLTVTAAVLCAYAILFALILLAAWVFVPGDYFQSILKHPVGFGEYLTLSWLAASLATVAGALGASLEDEETVRKASYGYRQRLRNENDDAETQ